MFSVGATVAALGVLLAVAGPPAAASEDPPHIVMLLADDLGELGAAPGRTCPRPAPIVVCTDPSCVDTVRDQGTTT